MNRDIQTFIIWKNARSIENEILNKIKKNFSILKEYEINWTPELFGENLSAFYGDNFIYDMFQRKTRGEGAFVLVIAEDLNPQYEYRITGRGEAYLNIHSFDLKQEIRHKTGTFTFHSSNNTKESRHDIAVLLGKSVDDFISSAELDGEREVLHQDTPPARGWKNLEEFFYILNQTCNYTVLRSWDALPDKHTYANNGDIDLLVDDMKAFLAILNPRIPTHKNIFHFFNWENFGDDNKNLLVHPKFVGDNYYDINMQRKILETRVLNEKGIYIPSEEMYFWSLLHHGVFHKENWQKYDSIFKEIAPKIGVEYKPDKEYLCQLMTDYMKKNNYKVAKHLDNKAASLIIKNIKDNTILKKSTEFYCYNHDDFRFLVFSEDAIFYNPELVTKCINCYDIFPDLHKHVIDKHSSIYKFTRKRHNQGEKLWHFTKRYNDVSLFSYKNQKNIATFNKEFLSGKNKVCSEYFTYVTEKNIKPLNYNKTVLDLLLEKYVKNGFENFQLELEKFVNEVFYRFQDKDSFHYLDPIAWDLLPKNCFYNEDTSEYVFFDKEVFYNKPLNKSMFIANLVLDFDGKFQFSMNEKYEIYSLIINKLRLEDMWSWVAIQRQKEVQPIVHWTQYSCYDSVSQTLNKKNILQKVFSVKNEYSGNKKHKVINLLGTKIKFKIKETAKKLAAVERERERERVISLMAYKQVKYKKVA